MEPLIAIVIGVVTGVLIGGLGGGGGILVIPALIYSLGMSPQEATTASLVVVAFTTGITTLSQSRSGNVQWRLGIWVGVVGLPGAWAGTRINTGISPEALLIGLAVLMIGAAIVMFVKTLASEKPTNNAEGTDVSQVRWGRQRLLRIVGVGLVTGFLTGLFGVGGGFVIIPALVAVLGVSIHQAIATSVFIAAANSVSALAGRIGSVAVDWRIVIPLAVAAVLAALAGKAVAQRLPRSTLQRMFAVLLVIVAGYVLVRA